MRIYGIKTTALNCDSSGFNYPFYSTLEKAKEELTELERVKRIFGYPQKYEIITVNVI